MTPQEWKRVLHGEDMGEAWIQTQRKRHKRESQAHENACMVNVLLLAIFMLVMVSVQPRSSQPRPPQPFWSVIDQGIEASAQAGIPILGY